MIGIFVVTAMLALGKDFFMPIALATLISFLLAPVAKRLEGWGLGRVPAVITTTFGAFLVMALAIYVVSDQFVQLAEALPGYKDNIRAKIVAIRSTEDGPFSKLMHTATDVSEELTSETEPASEQKAQPSKKANPQTAVPVRIVEQQPLILRMARDYLGALLSPLGSAAVVILIVIFMLIERQDLRDRFIHLVGRGRLYITTQAIDEAGTRVSRYLVAQLIVNVTYGIPIGVGLFFIGVPNAALWGMLAALLRFIPYIGPWIAAIPPILLSFAISPSWWQPVAAMSLFVVIELISNNVVEPWLYGSSTALSPIAIIISALFWTWLWGIGGLLLATPLTVCVAVLGKYVPNLSFLDVILGDKPPIAPEQRFYQRLLAGDETELFEMVEKYVDRDEHSELFDDVIVPALRQAEQDFSRGSISREERDLLFQRVRDALESIDGFTPAATTEVSGCAIIPARTEGDELAAHMLAFLLEKRGIHGRALSYRTLNSEVVALLSEAEKACVCVSALTPISAKTGELLLRRFTANGERRGILGLWFRKTDAPKREGVTIAASLRDAARLVGEGVVAT